MRRRERPLTCLDPFRLPLAASGEGDRGGEVCCILESVTNFRIDPRRERQQRCDRCGSTFEEGFTWPGLGIPIVLCDGCTADIEESVKSYGETGIAAKQRFLDRLREIGMSGLPAHRPRRS